MAACVIRCRDEIAAFGFGQRHRLFYKNVLPRPQRLERLRGVVLIAAGDENGIDFRVAQNLLIVGGAVSRAEPIPVALTPYPALRMDRAETHIRKLLQTRQMSPAGEI